MGKDVHQLMQNPNYTYIEKDSLCNTGPTTYTYVQSLR